MDVLSLNLTACFHVSLPYIMGFDIKIPKTYITRSHINVNGDEPIQIWVDGCPYLG